MIEGLEGVTVFFALVLALALLIERLLEVLKAGYDLADSRFNWYRFWTRRAERVRAVLDRKLRTLRFVKPRHIAALLARFDDRLVEGTAATGRVPVIAGDLVRAAGVKIAAKVLGIAAGIALAFWLDVNLVTYLGEPVYGNATTAPGAAGGLIERIVTFVAGLLRSDGLQLTASGVAMGLGSGPVHKLIRMIERRRGMKAAGGQA